MMHQNEKSLSVVPLLVTRYWQPMAVYGSLLLPILSAFDPL